MEDEEFPPRATQEDLARIYSRSIEKRMAEEDAKLKAKDDLAKFYSKIARKDERSWKLQGIIEKLETEIRELKQNTTECDNELFGITEQLEKNLNENGKLLIGINKCLQGIISNQEDFQTRLKKLEKPPYHPLRGDPTWWDSLDPEQRQTMLDNMN